MFSRPLRLSPLLRHAIGTQPFAEYCAWRCIPFAQTLGALPTKQDLGRWATALAGLPEERQARVEMDLAAVGELASADGNDHLVEAAAGAGLPPDSVPSGAPLALWFFLRQPALFREVFLHHQVERVDSWRQARAGAGIAVADLEGRAEALSEGLRGFFSAREGTRPFCVTQAQRHHDAVCFLAQVADRPRVLDAFTEAGRATARRLRPARALLFVYFPRDGTVLLRCPLRSRERIAALFTLLGDHALGCALTPQDDLFAIDRLKEPFRPLPDAPDMHSVRLAGLHLRYPDRERRRLLKLETLATDEQDAVERMLARHAGGALADLRVCYAEIQVGLLNEGRVKRHRIALWPDRSNLPESELGDRFRACLYRWGLCHARQR